MNDIVIRSLKKRYGDKTVFENLNLTLPVARTTAILAPSGYGKTTLLRLLLGLEKPDGGEILGLSGHVFSAVFQEDRLCESFSAAANLRLGAPGLPDAVIQKALQDFGLEHVGNQPVSSFSGGMKRRIALLRGLLAPSDFLILDEPFHGLDEALKKQVIRKTKEACSNKTVLLITHDPAEAEQLGAVSVIQLSAYDAEQP